MGSWRVGSATASGSTGTFHSVARLNAREVLLRAGRERRAGAVSPLMVPASKIRGLTSPARRKKPLIQTARSLLCRGLFQCSTFCRSTIGTNGTSVMRGPSSARDCKYWHELSLWHAVYNRFNTTSEMNNRMQVRAVVANGLAIRIAHPSQITQSEMQHRAVR